MLIVNKLANETPDGMHRMQYAAHILEELCAMPAKGNLELVADCILALSKSKHLSLKQAHDYLARAVGLAQKQRVVVDHFFFSNATYLHMRPEVESPFKEVDRKKQKELRAATEAEQATPEFQELSRMARDKLREIAGMKAMSGATEGRREALRNQIEQLKGAK